MTRIGDFLWTVLLFTIPLLGFVFCGIVSDYILSFLGIDVPFLVDMLLGLVTSPISIPIAICIFLIELTGGV